jgi:hypothetical protein
MNLKNCLYLLLILVFVATLTFGCVAPKGYGKLGFAQTKEPKMTLDQLVKDWENYDIYYSGVHEDYVFGIMFDPKDDERKLVGHEWWEPVETQEDLRQMILSMNIFKAFQYQPMLWKILGPDNQLYGFTYTARYPMIIKVIDDRTLWVDELTFPPLFEVNLRDLEDDYM